MVNDLQGVIDTHVHTSPDAVPRLMTDIELATAARDAGYVAVVLKSHHVMTADRAQLVDSLVEGVAVYGGLALNIHSCGGMNPSAVETAARVGARIVWMPTFTSQSHVRHSRTHGDAAAVRRLGAVTGEGTAVLDSSGRLLPETRDVLDIIAHEDLTLATGHLSGQEIMQVVPEARQHGVRRIIVTHPEMPCVGLDHPSQRELASLGGVWFERVYVLTLPPFHGSIDDVARAVHAVGEESTILATDLGQPDNLSPVEGMRAYVDEMLNAGFSDTQVREMTRDGPARALGLA